MFSLYKKILFIIKSWSIKFLLIPSLLLLILSSCSSKDPQSTFDTLGPVAKLQLELFYILFWVGLIVFILVAIAVFYIVFKYKSKPQDDIPEQIHGNTKLEIIWTVLPILLIAAIAIPSVQAIFASANPSDKYVNNNLIIDATGKQWWFEFEYPEYGLITANEIHIPIGEAVTIKLHSQDVLHSFWVPKLAGKVDMVPNNDNHLWLQADEPGIYYGHCAEFCGQAHALMRFKLIAETREEFEAWTNHQKTNAWTTSDPLAKQGMEIFMSRDAGCYACHTIQGTDKAKGNQGPNLTHFASRTDFAAGIIENNQENLRKWLKDPNSIKPGNLMSQNAGVYNGTSDPLTEQEISALTAFLRSLK